MSELERLITGGGTVGLIALLLLAVTVLARVVQSYINDLRKQRDDAQQLAKEAIDQAEDAGRTSKEMVDNVGRLATALERRNELDADRRAR